MLQFDRLQCSITVGYQFLALLMHILGAVSLVFVVLKRFQLMHRFGTGPGFQVHSRANIDISCMASCTKSFVFLTGD